MLFEKVNKKNILLFLLDIKGLILVFPHLITPIINHLNKQKRQRVH